jgi:predicted acylesterase/phospholipase RssA
MACVEAWYEQWRPKVLCLGAGGIKGLDELGAIWWFYSSGVLSKLDTYIGTSIGGIICAFLSMGFTPHEVLYYAIDSTMFSSISELKLTELNKNYGLVSNASFDDALGKRMKAMILKKFKKVPTLREHYEQTGNHLVLVVCSLGGDKLVYMDHKSHPDVDLITAMRSTSNAPGIFGKLEYQKDLLLDGAVGDPYPILHFDDGKTPILGIGVINRREFVLDKVDLISYYDRAMSVPLNKMTESAIASSSSQCYNMIIPVEDDMGLIDPSQRELRMKKFLNGYRFCEKHVVSHPHPIKVERKEGLPPLTENALHACLKSNAGKLILRAMKEDPSLFKSCLQEYGITLPTSTSSSDEVEETPSPPTATSLVPHHASRFVVQEFRTSGYQTSHLEDRQMGRHSPRSRGESKPKYDGATEDDEEILELPRMRPRQYGFPFPPSFASSFDFQPRQTRMSTDFVIQMRLSPDILHQILRIMKFTMKMTRQFLLMASQMNMVKK